VPLRGHLGGSTTEHILVENLRNDEERDACTPDDVNARRAGVGDQAVGRLLQVLVPLPSRVVLVDDKRVTSLVGGSDLVVVEVHRRSLTALRRLLALEPDVRVEEEQPTGGYPAQELVPVGGALGGRVVQLRTLEEGVTEDSRPLDGPN
jgi:hypothetical protein